VKAIKGIVTRIPAGYVTDGYDSSYLMLKNWGTLKTPMLQVYAKPGEDYMELQHPHGLKNGKKFLIRLYVLSVLLILRESGSAVSADYLLLKKQR
jgi:hypothetical protein